MREIQRICEYTDLRTWPDVDVSARNVGDDPRVMPTALKELTREFLAADTREVQELLGGRFVWP